MYSLENIINKDLIENKVKTPNIQENLINQKNKIQIENNNISNFKIIDGKIFDKNYKEEGDLIGYYKKKKLYLDSNKGIKELITKFKELKDKLKIKEKNIIELNNKIKEYESKIKQLNKSINEFKEKEKDIEKKMEELKEKGRIEIEKIESELNKYIDENNKLKKENEILLMKNKELEKEIKEIKLKYH